MGMRLTRLTMRGLKGRGEEVVDLSPATFFHGPNASGKTRIADALRLLALGYHPDEPRTSDGVLRLSAAGSIEIEGRFEDVQGQEGRPVLVSRSWRRVPVRRGADAGKVRTETDVKVSACRTGGRKAHEAAAEALFGEPVLYDLGELLDLSDPRRRRLLFRLGGGAALAAWDKDRVVVGLGAHASVATVSVAEGGWDGREDLPEWIDRTFVRLHDEALAAERDAAAEQAAEDGLRSGLQAPDPKAVGDLDARIRDAERAARAASKAHGEAIGSARAALDAGDAGISAIRRATADLATARDELRSLESGRPDVEALRTALSLLEDGGPGEGFSEGPAGIASLREAADAARRAMETHVDHEAVGPAKEALVAAEARLAEATEAHQAALRRREDCRADIGRARADADRLQRRLDALREAVDGGGGGFGGSPVCEACGQDVGREQIGRYAERVRIARAEHGRLDGALPSLVEAAETAVRAQAEAARSVRAAADALRAAGRSAEDGRAAARSRYEAADDAARERERAIADARRALEAGTRGGPDEARMGALRERISTLEAEAARPLPDLAVLRSDLAAAERRGREAEESHARSMEPLAAERDRLRAALRDLEQAEMHKVRRMEREIVAANRRAGLEAIGPRGLMGAVVRDVTTPFCDAVNRAIDGLDLGRFAVRLLDERGRPVFHLGLERGRTDMSDPLSPPSDDSTFAQLGGGGLSGGERAAVHAGVVLALSEMAGSAWTVAIVDEIQDLDRERRPEFMAAMASLQRAGRLDQVVMMGCPDIVDEVAGVANVDISAQSARPRRAEVAA